MQISKPRTAMERAIDALRRVDALDRRGPALGAVPVLNRDFVAEVGRPGRLSGRVCTVKDSFAVSGLPIAAGSPAFEEFVSTADATVVARLRAEGAAMLGKTNMPPVAIGGGQPGLYGRTVSPFNPDFLAAAWHSGSSIGSGVAVAAGFCDFGIGEETVSSGRSPASNNGLVAYTPSWGIISSFGNFPLHPYRDVVVPHATSMSSLREILRCIAGADERDVWYRQRSIGMLAAESAIAQLRSEAQTPSLEGMRFGVPYLYVGETADDVAGVPIRHSIKELWDRTEHLLRGAGAEVERVRLPVVESYERRTASLASFERQGFLPKGWTEFELGPLMTFAWSNFLDVFAGGATLADINPNAIRPVPPWSTDLRGESLRQPGRDVFDFERILAARPLSEQEILRVSLPAIRGLNEGRKRLFDEWMDELGLDALVFPANGDIGPWAADCNVEAAEIAWKDGAVFSHGNHVLRRVGIPTVTLPMGITRDIGMPVGVTVAGRAWDDARLLGIAAALERLLPGRPAPPLPPVTAERLEHSQEILPPPSRGRGIESEIGMSAVAVRDAGSIGLTVESSRIEAARVEVLGRTLAGGGEFRVGPSAWPARGRPLAIAVSEAADAAGFCEVALGFHEDVALFDGRRAQGDED